MITKQFKPWSPAKKYTIALSCATALASFSLIACPVTADTLPPETSSTTELVLTDTVAEKDLTLSETDGISRIENKLHENDNNLELNDTTENKPSSGLSQDTSSESLRTSQASPNANEEGNQLERKPAEEGQTEPNPTPPQSNPDLSSSVTGGHFYTDDKGRHYYEDKDGNLLKGAQVIDGQHLYFKEDGQQVLGEFVQVGQDYYYYDKDGHMVTNQAIETTPYFISGISARAKRIRYMGPDGKAVKGWHTVNKDRIYFDPETSEQKFFYMAVTVPSYRYPESHRRTIEGKDYYVSLDGTMWRNQFITMKNGSIRYLDDDGQEVTGPQVIDGFELYFHEDGTQAKGQIVTRDGNRYYYDPDQGRLVKGVTFTHLGKAYQADQEGHVTESQLPLEQFPIYRDRFVQENNGKWYYYDQDGRKVTGPYLLNNHQAYFRDDGSQVKGQFAPDGRFYDQEHGYLVTNRFVTEKYYGQPWYYVDGEGNKLTGSQVIQGKQYYFKETGEQIKGDFAPDGHYYDGKDGSLVRDRFVTSGNNNWYYVNKEGKRLTGLQVIKGKTYHFDKQGRQTKGDRVVLDGKGYYFHPDNGELWNNKPLLAYRTSIPDGSIKETWYYYDDDGNQYQGPITRDGKEYYYDPVQIRRNFHKNADGTTNFYDENGIKVYDRWVTTKMDFLRPGRNFIYPHYYVGKDGNVLKGFHTIKGQLYYFHPLTGQLIENTVSPADVLFTLDGKLYLSQYVRGQEAPNHIFTNQILQLTDRYYHGVYRADDKGVLTKITDKNRYINAGNQWYYINDKEQLLTGPQIIDKVPVYFDEEGMQVKGTFAQDGHYYDKDTGALVTKRYVQVDGNWYYLDAKGDKVIGSAIIDQVPVYFDNDGKQAKGSLVSYDGATYYYDKDTGERVSNRRLTIADETYYFDEEGRGSIVS